MRTINITTVLFAPLLASCAGYGEFDQFANVPGAVFTTTVDGAKVNENIYSSKEAVYLDGGPGPGAPASSAGLPEGDYFFQVTDPSGMTLLSSDDILCRRFHVGADGVISAVVEGPNGCQHATGTDLDHAGITVQLMPYADTPNPGGEYKVWVTPVDAYDGGFKHNASKTDNFKVRAPLPTCGNGVLDTGEQCDDGNTTSGDGCSSTCTTEVAPPTCGDGHLDSGEQCDDGNTANGDGCSSTCTTEAAPCCGDGHLDAGEQCDDGNHTDGDGCSSTCTLEPRCGDGHVDAGEECDDGNNTAGDGCSATCTVEVTPAPCCGDGHVDTGEQCDDGNTISGDGCSSTCTLEAVCGNGVLEGSEQCDDGNTTSGDGCSSTCTNEGCPNPEVSCP